MRYNRNIDLSDLGPFPHLVELIDSLVLTSNPAVTSIPTACQHETLSHLSLWPQGPSLDGRDAIKAARSQIAVLHRCRTSMRAPCRSLPRREGYGGIAD